MPPRRCTAPVNAPRRWPKSWLAASSSERPAQLTATNGPSRRALSWWIARATSSLPVPVSPSMSTGDVRRRDLPHEPDHALHRLVASHQVVEARLFVEEAAEDVQLRDIGEEEDLRSGRRGSSSISISTTHVAMPARRGGTTIFRRSARGARSHASMRRRASAVRPSASGQGWSDQRAGIGSQDAPAVVFAKTTRPRRVDEDDAGALDVEDREQVVVAAPQRAVEAVAMQRDLDVGTQIALIERLDDVAVRRRALRTLERRRVAKGGEEDDRHGQLGCAAAPPPRCHLDPRAARRP